MIPLNTRLAADQAERHIILMEECAEVQQAAAKLLRFGNRVPPHGLPRSNAETLVDELTDLVAVLKWMMHLGDVQIHGSVPPRLNDDEIRRIQRRIMYSAHQQPFRNTVHGREPCPHCGMNPRDHYVWHCPMRPLCQKPIGDPKTAVHHCGRKRDHTGDCERRNPGDSE